MSTVREVIKMLGQLDPDLEVVFEDDGDLWVVDTIYASREQLWRPREEPKYYEIEVAFVQSGDLFGMQDHA